MQSRFPIITVVAIAALATACLGGTTETPSTGPYFVITAYGGTRDTMILAASSATTVRAQVTHAGSPAIGAPVFWTDSGGDSRVVNASLATDTLGIASATWVASNSVRVDSLTLTTSDGTKHLFIGQVVPGPPSILTRVTASPDSVTAGAGATITAKVTDRSGNPIANAIVDWSASSGTLSAGSAPTNSSGVSTVTFTPPSPGTYAVTADLPNTASIIFTVVAK